MPVAPLARHHIRHFLCQRLKTFLKCVLPPIKEKAARCHSAPSGWPPIRSQIFPLYNITKRKKKKGVIYAHYDAGANPTEQFAEEQLRDCYEYAKVHNITIVGTGLENQILFMLSQFQWKASDTLKAYNETMMECSVNSVHLYDDKIIVYI